ncbi:MAG: hypothetical protein VX737_01085 [Pseudomonadota bacterium]|nr:hypothetical protein [Pseudomonadota bacterium]
MVESTNINHQSNPRAITVRVIKEKWGLKNSPIEGQAKIVVDTDYTMDYRFQTYEL